VAFHQNQRHEVTVNDTAGSLKVGGGKPGQGYPAVQQGMAVRRLTPRECERLQGFPDDYTLIPYRGKPAADGPRYKALGNSMAVPVMRWIGERIQMVEDMDRADAEAA
jgi:DNA (cytosine-5)-methyltransferase 1